MDSKAPLVCTVFDVAAQAHGPIFCPPNLPVMWRQVDHLMSEATSPRGEFVVVVHGHFDFAAFPSAFQPYVEPVAYSCADRTVVTPEGVRMAYEGMVSGARG